MRIRQLDDAVGRGRGPILTLAALAAGLLWPVSVDAAPPVAVSTASAVIGQSEFGTVKGRLVWGGGQVPPVTVLQEKGQAKDPVCAKNGPILSRELVVDPETKGVSFAFAYISRPQGANPNAVKALTAAHPKVEIDQKNCEFVPHIVCMHQDQMLVVKSSDPTNHNVHLSPFTNPAVNVNVASGGQLEQTLVAEKRPIRLNCDIHPWMISWIMVFDHPFFATTGKDGRFEIKGVPAGTQNLVLWQETVGYANPGAGRGMPVMVKAGEVMDVGEITFIPRK